MQRKQHTQERQQRKQHTQRNYETRSAEAEAEAEAGLVEFSQRVQRAHLSTNAEQ
jgi:hypothetical protein